MQTTEYVGKYIQGAVSTINQIDLTDLQKMIDEIIELKKRNARLFILGVGGSAANSSHAVNDFRKICGIETYAPTDNVSELTARTNDEGWDTVFVKWLEVSHLNSQDAVLVLSVGGGNLEKKISTNIVAALKYCQTKGTTILGIVSRDGGYTRKVATASVLIPVINDETITPYAESLQALLWHGIVNHPDLRA